MQSRNGGWGSFDADNTHAYLNHIPFADHGALLDPPTADVSARCLGLLAQLGDAAHRAGAAAAARLSAARAGAGRQLVRALGQQLHLRNLVGARGLQRRAESNPSAPEMRRAAAWLRARQRADGGWGESRGFILAGRTAWRSPLQHGVADRLGVARPDGCRRDRAVQPSSAASPVCLRPRTRMAAGTSRGSPRSVFRGCSFFVITATPRTFRCGLWPAIAGSRPAPSGARRSASDHSSGNPFGCRELCRMQVNTRGSRGSARCCVAGQPLKMICISVKRYLGRAGC